MLIDDVRVHVLMLDPSLYVTKSVVVPLMHTLAQSHDHHHSMVHHPQTHIGGGVHIDVLNLLVDMLNIYFTLNSFDWLIGGWLIALVVYTSTLCSIVGDTLLIGVISSNNVWFKAI